MKPTADERLIREFILQLKLGQVEVAWFRERYGIDVRERFRETLERHERNGFLSVQRDKIVLSRAGLLQVDGLLHDFFLDEHKQARYA